jgi:predicted RNA-binding Zn-ribbon protein involved in translation (DUF1610 family)
MEQSVPTPTLTCTQCGGELHPEEGQTFLTCPYCNSTVYLDKSRVVFHWSLAPTLSPEQALGALRRWMSGNQTVKDLDQKAQVAGQNFQYFPLWYFKRGTPTGEKIDLQPAAATSVTELARLSLPAGDLQRFDPALESQSEAPTVPLEAARSWLEQNRPLPQSEIRESALVHVPIYMFKYLYKGQRYTAVVEAATGMVLANIFPAKAEAPYLLAGGLTALVFLCLATMPLFSMSGSGGGSVWGWLVLIIGGVIAAPILVAFAAWVAAKI